ncbi:N-acetylmuramic acid 6-phosphate etherase [Taklimakanibacter deserti]|uniref:N-acetylmuramic acid 6-phosphate etherase n=1 Tax=Taklimakanibacter deserti TaxID=2267839 RepID=UPI000E65A1EE
MSFTESVSGSSRGLDQWDDAQILSLLAEGQARAVASVKEALPAVAKAAEALAQGLAQGGRIVYAGAGSSINIAVQDGAELPSTFGLERSRIAFVIAGGEASLFDIDAKAEDDTEAALAGIAALALTPADTVIALSASGATPFTLIAARAAKAAKATVIAIANNPKTPLLAVADHAILLATGPEVIVGSTRMGAGTAQKCALGLISTLAHIKLGAIYDGWMIRLQADNAKLRKRAERMVADIAKVDEAAAGKALAETDGHVAPAALICAGAKDVAAAEALLAKTNGNLRLALEHLAGFR